MYLIQVKFKLRFSRKGNKLLWFSSTKNIFTVEQINRIKTRLHHIFCHLFLLFNLETKFVV